MPADNSNHKWMRSFAPNCPFACKHNSVTPVRSMFSLNWRCECSKNIFELKKYRKQSNSSRPYVEVFFVFFFRQQLLIHVHNLAGPTEKNMYNLRHTHTHTHKMPSNTCILHLSKYHLFVEPIFISLFCFLASHLHHLILPLFFWLWLSFFSAF